MSHLSFESIARLVDEQPSALDNAHLESCATCRAELASMRADIAALADLPDMDPAADAWDAIESRLEAEGLLRKHADVIPMATRRRSTTYTYLARAAAVGAIFVGGALVGRTMAASGVKNTPPNVASNGTQTGALAAGSTNGTQVANTTPNASETGSSDATSGAAANAPVTANAGTPAAQQPGSVRLASTGNGAPRNTGRNDESGDAALRSLRDAEDKYFSALSRYSEKAGTETNDPNARLAALEGIVLTTRAALAQAPTDPVINGYHLTALAQRDAMLKQIRANPARSW